MQKFTEILIVDDDPAVCSFFKYLLSDLNLPCTTVNRGEDAKREFEKTNYSLVFLDLMLPDTDGITLLKAFKQINPLCPIIIMTGFSTVKSAVEAVRLGAYDYIDKPFGDITALEVLIKKALLPLSGDQSISPRSLEATMKQLGYLPSRNSQMQQIFNMISKVAARNLSILITGETGTGKEMLARLIHNMSSRSEEPFIAINCGALTDSLLESELFGHEKGAFTGANVLRRGIFEIADKGTLFLDEIGEASVNTQVKLLRILETGEFQRVGGEVTLKTDVRIITATNVDLEKAIAQGKFRRDLLYRLDVVKLSLPPLRERLEDLPLFIESLIKKEQSKGLPVLAFSPETIKLLLAYDWPGNLRELTNVLTQALALADGNMVLPEHLPEKLRHCSLKISNNQQKKIARWSWSEALKDFENEAVNNIEIKQGLDLNVFIAELKNLESNLTTTLIEAALRETLGDKKKAASLLGITPRTLRYLYREKRAT